MNALVVKHTQKAGSLTKSLQISSAIDRIIANMKEAMISFISKHSNKIPTVIAVQEFKCFSASKLVKR